jgi:hypothetical protein
VDLVPEITPSELQGQLRETIAILAASAEEQLAYVENLGLPVDELHGELADAEVSFLPRLMENNLIDEAVKHEIRALLAIMEGMPDADLWQPESLSMPEWDVVRRRAAVALASLDRFR